MTPRDLRLVGLAVPFLALAALGVRELWPEPVAVAPIDRYAD